MLIKRSNAPFKGSWALPGGYNPAGETTKEALRNIVNRKAGTDVLKNLKYIEQLYTFDTVARDPRGHAVSVTYMGCGTNIAHSGGSEETSFFAVDELPPLAYDHQKIIAYARERLAAKLTYTNAVYGLLQPKFTLTELQKSYEAVFGRELDKRNFRKKFLSLNLIKETNEISKSGAHRPARLFEFNSKSLETLSRSFD
jgi:8-oxo-dGTP diphosphatase